jgi:hypothetical protein
VLGDPTLLKALAAAPQVKAATPADADSND